MTNEVKEQIQLGLTIFGLKELIRDYADECGWISETQFCVWVNYEDFNDFITDLKDIFGNYMFDDGGFDANMQTDGLCIDLCEALNGYDFPFEEVFPKDEYAH